MVDFNGNVNGKNLQVDLNFDLNKSKPNIRRSDFERSPKKDEVSFSGNKNKPEKTKTFLPRRIMEKISERLVSRFIEPARIDEKSDLTLPEREPQMPKSDDTEMKVLSDNDVVYETEDSVVDENETVNSEDVISEIEEEPCSEVKTPEQIIAEQSAEIERLKMQLEKSISASEIKTKELEVNQKQIKELTEALENASTDVGKASISKYKTQYSDIAENANLSFSHNDAPSNFRKQFFPFNSIVFKTENIRLLQRDTEVKEKLNTEELKEQFHNSGRLSHVFSPEQPVNAQKSKNAYIKESDITDLGIAKSTGMTVDYGRRIKWSSNKIARDIMQNFYDGHGNTLDGVSLSAEKLPNGKTKIKISGQGVFAHDNLQYLGSGSKEENPYNAGGFGEGSRILVANLLASKSAENITYSSADWKLTFDAQKVKGSDKDLDIVMQTLEKREEPIDGNYIEFETTDNNLVDAIIDSVNYFNHSENPDFQNLDYDSKDFAFKFLPDKETGNLYMTQRFEFEGEGNWENNVENLTVIFKRKPDAEKFKEITGKEMPKDRDRTSYSYEDIKDFTHYFAHFMSNDDIMKTIVTTRPLWNDIYTNPKQSALKSFISGMLLEAGNRKLKLDTGTERLAYKDCFFNETVANTLKEYNYTVLPLEFSSLGILRASDTFKNLSAHNALEPTEIETQKLKLLEEGVAIVQDNIEKTLIEHLKKMPELNFNFDYADDSQMAKIASFATLKQNSDNPIISDMMSKYNISLLYGSGIENMPVEDRKIFVGELMNGVEKFLKESAETGQIDSQKILDISLTFLTLSENKSSFSGVGLNDYLYTLKNLNLITKDDIRKPRYIFDRHNEIASNTLGEAIVNFDSKSFVQKYDGHWVDKEYLATADFQQILGTWLHEICHKCGGDGSPAFTYALTDLCRVLLRTGENPENSSKLAALEEVYNNLEFNNR